MPNLSSVGCLAAKLESGTPPDGQTDAAGRQVKIELTQASLRWC